LHHFSRSTEVRFTEIVWQIVWQNVGDFPVIMKYLKLKNGHYHFYARVPARFKSLTSANFIEKTLRTDSYNEAQRLAFIMYDTMVKDFENKLSASAPSITKQDFEAAVALARTINIEIKKPEEILELDQDNLVNRVLSVKSVNPDPSNAIVDIGLLGTGLPKNTIMEVAQDMENLKASNITLKNGRQEKNWKQKYIRATEKFIAATGADKSIVDVNADDVFKYKKYLVECIDSIDPNKKISIDYANKHLGYMRTMIDAFYWNLDVHQYENPFHVAAIKYKPVADAKTSENGKESFTPLWISENIINHNGKLDGLNDEARAILDICAETGARLSETYDISDESIFLHAPIPYIRIQNETKKGQEREIKTAASNRDLPLVGAALHAFKKFPKGFPQYRGTPNLSNAVNKYLKENLDLPSPEHTAGSLRHSMEIRLLRAGVSPDDRGWIMGHSQKAIRRREVYGSAVGIPLKALFFELVAIETPYFKPRKPEVVWKEVDKILKDEGYAVR
jgi:integrase